jgi:RNA methyltransferase, TrmH family
MLSKGKLKYIKSLQLKKYRKEEQCFLVEGAKSVAELLSSDFEVTMVLSSHSWLKYFEELVGKKGAEIHAVSEKELTAAGSRQTNDEAIAVARMKSEKMPVRGPDEFILILDGINDPGNLGTIIRTADWYRLRHIVASEDTADFYNPKVIAASMGSFIRVSCSYISLPDFIRKDRGPVYGTYADGQDVHTTSFATGGLIVIGNESKGISPDVGALVTHRIGIPRYGRAESLNAGIATAVVLDNLRRLEK